MRRYVSLLSLLVGEVEQADVNENDEEEEGQNRQGAGWGGGQR